MALNPSGAISLAGPTAGQSIAVELGQGATSLITLNDTTVRTLAGKASGVITMPTDFWGKSNITVTPTYKGIVYGGVGPNNNVYVTKVNLVSAAGIVGADVPIAPGASARYYGSVVTYGGDKAIAAFGQSSPVLYAATTNLISNTGSVAATTPAVPGVNGQYRVSGCGYGSDKAIWAYGTETPSSGGAVSNRINYASNTGVMAADVPQTAPNTGPTAKGFASATRYGGAGAGIYVCGYISGVSTAETSLISATGVIASSTPAAPGVNVKYSVSAFNYGTDKAIYAFGNTPVPFGQSSNSCLISNTGVVAADVSNAPVLGKIQVQGMPLNATEGIFVWGQRFPTVNPMNQNTNKVSNTGVMASDVLQSSGVAVTNAASAGYSSS